MIPAGSSETTVNISSIQDSEVEIIETILLEIASISNASTEVERIEVQLIDDDEPSVSGVVQAGSQVVEGGVEVVTLTATIDNPASFDVLLLLESISPEVVDDFDFEYPGQGEISTIDTAFSLPRGIAVDSENNIYIANSSDNNIVRIDASGNRAIFAGPDPETYGYGESGSTDATDPTLARFSHPTGIAIDAEDNLYITDHNNHTIRKITPDGVVTTLAGSAGLSGDLDGTGSSSRFDNPRGITIGDDGVLYIADKNNNKIKAVTTDGVVTTLAGSGNYGFQDGDASSAMFARPANVFWIADGSILVADKQNGYLRKIASDGNVSTISNYLWNIQGIAVSSNGDIYATSTQENYIYKLVGASFEIITGGQGFVDGDLTEAKFNRPSDLIFDNERSLIVVDMFNNAIRKVDNRMKIVVPAGETSGAITLFAVNDLEEEPAETVELQITESIRTLYSSDIIYSFDIIDDEFGFTEVDNTIPGLTNASISWADYDRDGDWDVAFMGDSDTQGRILKIYENENGEFLDSNQNLTSLSAGDLAWVDVNNDGYTDLVAMGINGSSQAEFIIYYNESGNSFVAETNHGIEALVDGQMEWGDFDNDGLRDLIVTGVNSGNNYVTELYKNVDGNGAFIKDQGINNYNNQFISGFVNGDMKILDHDLDGDNDFVYTGKDVSGFNISGLRTNSLISETPFGTGGYTYGLPNLKNATIEYFNEADTAVLVIWMGKQEDESHSLVAGRFVTYTYDFGDGLFSESHFESGDFGEISDISKYINGDIAIADANNDGVIDLIITGEDDLGSPQTDIWFSRNGRYELQDFGIKDLEFSTADWIDYDNDGDMDIFISGTSQSTGNVALIYENGLVDLRSNTSPSAPSDLQVSDLGNGNVRFEWSKPNDDYSNSLGYNLRIGTVTGEAQILNPATDLETGSLLVQEVPLTSNSFYETNLPPGNYFWSVQAVDEGFLASSFSPEESFTLLYEWRELNLGGIVDRRLEGSGDAILEFFDVDEDEDLDILFVEKDADTADGGVVLYLNQDGLFSPLGGFRNDNLAIYESVNAATVGDINNDGLSDLAFSFNSAGTLGNVIMFGTSLIDDQNSTNPYEHFEYFYDYDYGLADAKMSVLDINNDGSNELIIAGATSTSSNGVPKLYVLSFSNDSGVNTLTSQYDLSDQIALINDAEFDFGDIDNDQDIDFIITGFDPNSGIRSELYLNETTSSDIGEIVFAETDDELAATRYGTVDLVDFDGGW